MMADHPKCMNCKKKFSIPSTGTANRAPKLLRCGHTFCKNCVSKWAIGKQEIECPACSIKTPCRNGRESVQRLWPNVYIAGLIACMQELPSLSYRFLNFDRVMGNQQHTEQKKLGQRCSECINALASCRCIHCQVNMCKKCFGVVHSHSRFLRQHQSVPLRPSLITTECDIHCRLLEFFCEDDVVPICPECTINADHKGHSIIRMIDKYKSLEDELKIAQAQTCSALSHTEKVRSMLMLELENVQYDAYQQADYLHQCFQDCVGTLQARFLGLLRELQTCAEKCCDDVVELMREVDAKEFPIREAFDDAELVLSDETRRQVVANPDKILAVLKTSSCLPFRLEKVKVSESDDNNNEKEDKTDDGIARFEFSLNPEILLTIQQLGDIKMQSNIKYRLKLLRDCPGLLDIPVQGFCKEDNVGSEIKPNSQLLRQLKEPHAKCQELVHVTSMDSPSNFRVQRWADKFHLEAIERSLNVYKTRKPMVDEILTRVTIGDSCVAIYEPTRSWYRARIAKILKNENGLNDGTVDDVNRKSQVPLPEDTAGPQDLVEVIYVDFGNHATTKVSCLRRMPEKLKAIPDLAIKCALNNLSPINSETWSQEVITYFSKMIGNRPLLMTTVKREKGYRLVDLHKPAADEIDADVPTSVRDAFLFLGLGCLCRAPLLSLDSVVGNSRKFLTPSLLPVSTFINVTLSDMESLNKFSVQLMDSNMSYLTQLMGKIQTWVQKQLHGKQASAFADGTHQLQIICPTKGMVCIAQYHGDGKWYRAQISCINENQTVNVTYVDYGDKGTVHFSKLLKIPEVFIHLPIQALPCELCDVSPLTGEEGFSEVCCRRFAELCCQSQMLMEVRDIKDGIYFVELFDYTDEDPSVLSISDRLCREGYIVRSNKSHGGGAGDAEVEAGSPTLSEAGNDIALLESIKALELKDAQSSKCKARVTNALAPNLFYVQSDTQLAELNKMMLMLQKDMEDTEEHTESEEGCDNESNTWNEGDDCIVKSRMEKRWCRGKVEAVENNENEAIFQVILTDYGWKENRVSEDLRNMPGKYKDIKEFVTKCCLGSVRPAGGSPKWTSTAVTLFKELVTGEECLMELCAGAEGIFDELPVDIWIRKGCRADLLNINKSDDYVRASRLLELEGLALPVKSRRREEDLSYNDILDSGATLGHHSFKPVKVRQTGEKIANPIVVSNCEEEKIDEPIAFTQAISDSTDNSEEGTLTVTTLVGKFAEDEIHVGGKFADAEIDVDENVDDDVDGNRCSKRFYARVDDLPSSEYVPCFVSHIEDLHTFYITRRPVVKNEDGDPVLDRIFEWDTIMKQVQDVAKNVLAPLTEDDLVVGEPCLCRYIGDEMWHRAIILKAPATPQSVPVQYVDFGTVENVPMGRLRRIPDCLLEIPLKAFLCRLVSPPTVSEAMSEVCLLEELTRRVEGKDLVAKVAARKMALQVEKHFKSCYIVTLYNTGCDGALLDINND